MASVRGLLNIQSLNESTHENNLPRRRDKLDGYTRPYTMIGHRHRSRTPTSIHTEHGCVTSFLTPSGYENLRSPRVASYRDSTCALT